ncbi:MAG: ribose-phosphate pyrophosphokinase [Anaerolineae bacterium]|nr:ribose-phosphate pyrophosphokinase [Thermoflexales bacterium]MDW8407168.1 ribose-phosphate pyrophosphokinase [Anaerolineae bacterium]
MRNHRRTEKSMHGGIKLFSGSSHPLLAAEIANYLDTPLCGRDIVRFPNENIFWRLHESVRGQDVFLIQTMSSPVSENILELLIGIDCLRRDSAARITVVIPYLAYARSDKKDQPRVPITARLLADLIETAGADRYITVDLHAGQIQGFFSIPGDEITAFHTLSDYFIGRRDEMTNPVIVTADLGFAKRGRNFAAKLQCPMAFVEKRRIGNTAQSEALTVIGDVDGCDVIIVDDEISTGGSVQNTIQVVKSHGAREIYVCCTHAVLAGPAVERLRTLPIKEIVTTNTLPLPPEKSLPNLRMLSIGSLLGEVIRRVHEGRSVGELFNE